MDRRAFIKNIAATGAATLGITEYASGFIERLLRDAQSPGARHDTPPIRPPGALDEAEFLSRCIRCQRCVDACPNRAIVALDEAFGPHRASTPAIKPRRQACMLCNQVEGDYLKCTEACPSGALRLIRKQPEAILREVRMGTAEIDRALCYSYNDFSCGACYRACPFPDRAMSLGLWERPEVHAEACVGCGLCERACIRYPQAVRIKPRARRSA